MGRSFVRTVPCCQGRRTVVAASGMLSAPVDDTQCGVVHKPALNEVSGISDGWFRKTLFRILFADPMSQPSLQHTIFAKMIKVTNRK